MRGLIKLEDCGCRPSDLTELCARVCSYLKINYFLLVCTRLPLLHRSITRSSELVSMFLHDSCVCSSVCVFVRQHSFWMLMSWSGHSDIHFLWERQTKPPYPSMPCILFYFFPFFLPPEFLKGSGASHPANEYQKKKKLSLPPLLTRAHSHTRTRFSLTSKLGVLLWYPEAVCLVIYLRCKGSPPLVPPHLLHLPCRMHAFMRLPGVCGTFVCISKLLRTPHPVSALQTK